ncbi:hypothetical protein B0F90DRAFT_1817029 [Multifurca ochricompacta]|uniref:Uncharacterized protein n=1 Tax=Multifurca ochricompacta TaxID=376703 RepID=A0AAD4QMH3_9AGAM|nr:hypothetical protein B0F90DRAFT_1817029 [Multifurca ochricompacta]
MRWTTDFFSGSQPKSIVITSPSSSAIISLTSRDPKRFTADFILFQNSLTSFISSFPGTSLTFIWAPTMTNYRAQTVSAQAAEHCRARTPLDTLNDRPSLPSEDPSPVFVLLTTGARIGFEPARITPRPPPTPSDGISKPIPCPSTAHLMVVTTPSVGHAFTAEYAIRFKPKLTPSSRSCSCDGITSATTTHILYDCPLHRESRIASNMHTWSSTATPLMTIFNTKNLVEALLRFLQNSRAAFKPCTAILPPEPD